MDSKKKRVIMLVVPTNDIIMIATPPNHPNDRYGARAAHFCTISNIQKIITDWEGKVYIVSGGDLYAGPMPLSKTMDWYAAAKKVAKKEFSLFQHLFFHPNGDLWGVTTDGRLYMGPPPTNQYLSWMYGKATLIGERWNQFDAIFFDATGNLYAVHNTGKMFKGSTPTVGANYTREALTLWGTEWNNLTYHMSADADGNMWMVSKVDGNMYKGPLPVKGDNYSYYMTERSTLVGPNYNRFKFICMTVDKTVESMSGFEFLPKDGQKISETTEVLEEKIYDNFDSTNVLKHSFTFKKDVAHTSTFTHEHGFAFEVGLETSFSAGIPKIGQAGTTVTMNTSTSHNWSFTTENETKHKLKNTMEVEVQPGKAIRVVASFKKAILDIPYRVNIRTMFGLEDCIEGTWRGATHYNLNIMQEDFMDKE